MVGTVPPFDTVSLAAGKCRSVAVFIIVQDKNTCNVHTHGSIVHCCMGSCYYFQRYRPPPSALTSLGI